MSLFARCPSPYNRVARSCADSVQNLSKTQQKITKRLKMVAFLPYQNINFSLETAVYWSYLLPCILPESV